MDLLLYVVDALRADHLSCYGYGRSTTPNIDALAEEGLLYRQCFTPATWTKPVSASVLTGAYPPTHGTRTREDTFDADIRRLPELLAEEGYETGGFSAMGNVSASIGYDRGFDAYYDLYKDPAIVERRATSSADSEELAHETEGEIALPRASDVRERLTDWVEATTGEFFAFCWSIDPHIPYDPPADFREFVDPAYAGSVNGQRETLPAVTTDEDLDHLKGLYDGEIRYSDHEFGQVVERLRKLGLYEETMIVLIGDHGDAFMEHGRLTHGHLPFEELIHVPCVIKPPASHDHNPRTIEETVALIDLVPTILHAAGIDDRPETIQGRSIPPYGPAGSSTPVYSETRSREIYPTFYSVRTDQWKYMTVEEPDRTVRTLIETAKQVYRRGLIRDLLRHPRYYFDRYSHDEDEFLYDVAEDPEERHNRIQDRSDIAAQLRNQLHEWVHEGESIHESLASLENIRIDPETDEQLRQLGYVD